MNRHVLRREKRTPCDDFWHTMRIGLVAFVVLMIVLPIMFRMI